MQRISRCDCYLLHFEAKHSTGYFFFLYVLTVFCQTAVHVKKLAFQWQYVKWYQLTKCTWLPFAVPNFQLLDEWNSRWIFTYFSGLYLNWCRWVSFEKRRPTCTAFGVPKPSLEMCTRSLNMDSQLSVDITRWFTHPFRDRPITWILVAMFCRIAW